MTSTTNNETRLAKIRVAIDALDASLVELLSSRAKLSREVGRIKADSREAIFKPFREKEVLDRLVSLADGTLPEEHLRAIYREILSSSRRLQRPQKVAFLGPEGTFSHFAGMEYLGHSLDYEPKKDFKAIFSAVAAREADLGVVPLENSLHGSVGQSLDLFLKYEVFVQAEIYCKISNNLLSREQNLSDIQVVYSHAQPLAQCAEWLRNNLGHARMEPVESTAAAAQRAAGEPGAAAVGHSRLAPMHNLNILAGAIEDLQDNWTRFLIIGPTPPKEGNRDKTSILFTLPDTPGALVNILQVLAREGINMKKLESRPLRSEKWKYVFFADVECDLTRDQYRDLLTTLKNKCHTLRVLGSYPAGPYLEMGE